jgi:DnaJ-class molecular chaperone
MKQTNRNPWDILNIATSASQEEIKQAFKKLAMKHHPDRGGKSSDFNAVVLAYEKLRKNTIVPIIVTSHTHVVNVKLTIKQQIEGVDDYIETDTGEILKVVIPSGSRLDDKYKVNTPIDKYIVNIKELSHKVLTRQGLSLIMNITIDIVDAMGGSVISVLGPCDEQLEIKIPAGSQDGLVIVIPEKGLMNKLTKKRAGLHIIVNTEIPTLDTDTSIDQFILRLKECQKLKTL